MEKSNRYGDLDAIVDQIFGTPETPQVEAAKEVQPAAETEAGKPEEAPQEVEATEAVEEAVEASEDGSEETPSDGESEEEATDVAEQSDEDESAESTKVSEDENSFLQKLVTVKVNGEEMQIPVDQAVKGYQLAAAANKKFEEAATIRKEAAEAVDFRETFDRLWASDQKQLVSHFVSIADDVNGIVEAVILQAAAMGKLSPSIAEALEITPEISERLAMKHQREQLANERLALQAERQAANVNQDEIPDEYGYTVADYRTAIDEIVKVAGLTEASPDERRALIETVFKHGDDTGITNPYLAYASYQSSQARKEVERSNRAKKAVAKVAKTTKTSAALSPKGQVQHTPTAPVMKSTADAAAWALQELERQVGAL
jgi:hypothetical protein